MCLLSSDLTRRPGACAARYDRFCMRQRRAVHRRLQVYLFRIQDGDKAVSFGKGEIFEARERLEWRTFSVDNRSAAICRQ